MQKTRDQLFHSDFCILTSLLAFICKNFRGEGFDGCAMLPGIKRNASFSAGLPEKRETVPSVLDWNLRQQQSALAFIANDQTVPSDLDFFCRDRNQRRKNTQ